MTTPTLSSSRLHKASRSLPSFLGLLLLLLTASVAAPRISARPAGDLITPRNDHTATLLPDGRVLLAAGDTITTPPYVINKAEFYDPTTNSWNATGDLNVARYFHSAV